jgi:valyl-tRNA synthetase
LKKNIRILTTPVRLTGAVHPQQLASLVSIDAMVRRRAQGGDGPVSWPLTTIIGDAAVQRAVQLAVRREGTQRDEIGREGFEDRARQLGAEAAANLRELLGELGINADLDTLAPESDTVRRAARVAFVRLYESGLLSRTDAVLDACPSCETVVDAADVNEVETDIEFVRVSLETSDGTIEIDVAEPELWVGAVAVAVPVGAEVDERVFLPLLDAEVPVFAVEGLQHPVVLVPGHDHWSHDLAKQLSLPIVEVLDSEGIVRQQGPLESLGRFAARAAAIEQLGHSGSIVAHFSAQGTVKRCHRCATQLVPLYGRHWILKFSELVDPVTAAIRAGEIAFTHPSDEAHMLELAERAGSWCVSQQLWSGHPIPAFTCLDCGQVTVSVEEPSSCGSCMGTLAADSDVLDARFMAAVSPLAAMGWPAAVEDLDDVTTMLSVGRIGLDAWALPIAALGLRLLGSIPYSVVATPTTPVGVTELGRIPTQELIDLVRSNGREVVRSALLAGDLDIERAGTFVEAVLAADARPAPGELIERYDKAIGMLEAGEALVQLVNSARLTSEESAQDASGVTLGDLGAPIFGAQ